MVRYVIVRRLLSISTLTLVVATHKLWFPSTAFPIVPMTAVANSVPLLVDWVFSVGMVALLVGWALVRAKSRFAVALPLGIALCFAVLVLLNQHRAQPWAYLAALGCVLFVGFSPVKAFAGMRLLFIAVYFYSAISKLDFLFLQKMGVLFVETGFEILHINPGLVSPTVKRVCIIGIPIYELLTALALIFPSTRRLGMPMAIVMHIALLVLLGPWGLSHKPAVLIWNLFFIIFAYLLFNRPIAAHTDDLDFGNHQPGILQFGTVGIFSLVLVAPAFEGLGWWDQWPSWSLYADRTEKMELFVRRNRLVDLPPAVRNYVGPSGSNDEWAKLYVEAWAIGETDSPAYPQARFYVGMALDLAHRCKLGKDVRINLYGVPHRMSGSRQAESIVGQEEITKRAKQFYLNAMPRNTTQSEQD